MREKLIALIREGQPISKAAEDTLDAILDTLREPDEEMKFEGMQADFHEGANYAFEFAGAAFTAMIDHIRKP